LDVEISSEVVGGLHDRRWRRHDGESTTFADPINVSVTVHYVSAVCPWVFCVGGFPGAVITKHGAKSVRKKNHAVARSFFFPSLDTSENLVVEWFN
jgi:hypothetical protein